MMAGYYLLTGPLREEHHFGNLLTLLFLLNLYECLLIVTAVFLFLRRPGHPHRQWLISIEIIFLCDPTFLTEAIGVVNPRYAFVVGGFTIALTAVKLAILTFLLGERMAWLRLVRRLIPFVFIALVPVWIQTGNGDVISWIGWNILATLIVVASVITFRQASSSSSPSDRRILTLVAVLPFAAAMLHLLASDFVRSIPIRPCYFSCMALALTAIMVTFHPPWRRRAGVILAGATIYAALLSIDSFHFANYDIPGFGRATLSGLSVVFAFSGLLYLRMTVAWRRWSHCFPAFGNVLLAVVGGDFRLLTKPMILHGRESWGLFLIVLAFVALISGIVVSLLLRNNGKDETTAAAGDDRPAG